MKYTYQISFNSSDYIDLTPGLPIQMSGEWIEGTKIWRENISELKITKAENSSIYDTLESYFVDSTKFDTQIFVKILKNSAQDSLHWFGIKWGRIDRETKTYEVQPLVYDYWSRYFEEYLNVSLTPSATGVRYFAHDSTTNGSDYYPYMFSKVGNNLMDRLQALITESGSGWSSSNVVSSFLGGDNNEAGSWPYGFEYGIKKDYVTDEQSYLHNSGGYFEQKQSIKDLFDLLELFKAYPYFDTNDKLRIEHFKFFYNKLIDNAVDFSSYIEDYDDKWSYDNDQRIVSESISMNQNDDQENEDFLKQTIVYSNVRNRPDIQTRDFNSQYFSDLEYYFDESLTHKNLLFSGLLNMPHVWFNSSFTSWSSTKNYIKITSSSGIARSNNFAVKDGTNYSLSINATLSGTIKYQLFDVTGAISNELSTSGTFTTTAASNDAYLRIYGAAAISFDGYIILNNTSDRVHIPSLEGVVSEDVKSNAAFSVANIFANYWQDNRPTKKADFDGVEYDFDTSDFILRRDDIRIHYSGVINPLYGFNDGTRIGMIEKWERDLDTDYYTLSILYQEDD